MTLSKVLCDNCDQVITTNPSLLLVNKINAQNVILRLGRSGSQVVSVLTFYSNNKSSSPAEVYSYYYVSCLKRTKIN